MLDKKHYPSEHIISVFVKSLSDVLRPAYCCKFYNCLLLFLNEPSLESAPDSVKAANQGLYRILVDRPEFRPRHLRSHFHELFAACISFLTVTRSREDMRELRDRMEDCSCDQSDPVVKLLHSMSEIDERHPSDDIHGRLVMDSLRSVVVCMSILVGGAISDCPNDLKEIKKVLKKAATHGKHVPWPTTPREILGDDVESTVTMLCRWLDENPSLPLLKLLHLVGFKCGREAVISMLLSATLPKNLVNLMDLSFREVPPTMTSANARGLVEPLRTCFITILTLEMHPDGVSVAYFYDDQCGRLLEVLTKVAYLADRAKKAPWGSVLATDINLWEKVIGTTGGAVHSKLELPSDKTKYHIRILIGSDLMRQKRLKDREPWQNACDYMGSLMSLDRCAYPLCNESFTGTGRKFQYCGGCRRVPYCSVDHQRSDVRIFSVSPHFDTDTHKIESGSSPRDRIRISAKIFCFSVKNLVTLLHSPPSLIHKS